MKISSYTVDSIADHIQQLSQAEISWVDGQQKTVHALDDLTASFDTRTQSFEGLIFEVLYKNFIVLSDYSVLMEDIEGNSEPVVVRDSTMIQILEEFLQWRVKVLKVMEANNATLSSH